MRIQRYSALTICGVFLLQACSSSSAPIAGSDSVSDTPTPVAETIDLGSANPTDNAAPSTTVETNTSTDSDQPAPTEEPVAPVAPPVYDEGVVMQLLESTPSTNSNRLYGTVVIALTGATDQRYPANGVTVSIEGDASFTPNIQPEFCAIVGGDVQCGVPKDTAEQGFVLHYFAEKTADITFNANLAPHPEDKNLNNNSIAQKHSLYPAERLSMFPSNTGVVVIDQAQSLSLSFNKPHGRANADVEITLSASTGLSLTNIMSERNSEFDTSAQAEQCVGTDAISCSFNNVRSSEGGNLTGITSDNGTIHFDVNAQQPGRHVVTYSVKSSNPEGSGATGIVALGRFVVYKAESTDSLQALINQANDGDTVTLPAGYYAGTLDGTYKSLHIIGNEGPGRTILMSNNEGDATVENLGKQSILQNIEFLSGAAAVDATSTADLTIIDSEFSPFNRNYADRGPLIRTTEQSQGLRFSGNKVQNYGRPFSDASCYGFIATGSGQSLHMTDNVFANNDCDNYMIVVDGSDTDTPLDTTSVYIKNNTFVNNKKLILQSSKGMNHLTRIENNIFLDNFILLDTSYYSIDRNSPSVITNTNIVFSPNVDRSQYSPTSSAGGKLLSHRTLVRLEGVAETADLEIDPSLIDVEAGDYSLASISQAIDAGLPTHRFETSDGSAEVFPYQESRVLVDGLLDGGQETDLGAMEFTP